MYNQNQNDYVLNGGVINNTILQTNPLFIPTLKNAKTTLTVGKTDLSKVNINKYYTINEYLIFQRN